MTQYFQIALRRWVAMVERFPVAIVLAILVITGLAAFYSFHNFRINSDLGSLIKPSSSTRWYAQNEVYKKAFPQYQDTTLVVVSSVSAAGAHEAGEELYRRFSENDNFTDVFAPGFDQFFVDRALYGAPVEGVKRLSEAVEESIPELKALYQSPTIPEFIAQLEDRLRSDAKIDTLSDTTKEQLDTFADAVDLIKAGEAPTLALVEPLRPRDTEEIHYQLIVLKSKQIFSEELPNKVIIHNIRDVIKAAPIPANVDVRVTGEVALANDEISAGLGGVELAGTLSLVLLALILGLGIRSISVISAIFAMLAVGIVWTSAFASFAVGSYNTLSLIFLVMFFGLGVDFAVHYCLRVMEAVQKNTVESRSSAAVEAAGDIGSALALCSITSGIAFLAFLPTAYKGLAELGIISAGGMIIAFLLSVSLFPAWFALFGTGVRKTSGRGEKLRGYSMPNLPPKMVLVVSAVIGISAAWYSTHLRFDYSVLAMHDESTEAMSTMLEMQSHEIVTDYSISVLVDAEADVDELINNLLALESVAKVKLPEQYLPKFQDIKYGYMQPVAEKLQQFDEPAKTLPLNIEKSRASIVSLDTYLQEDASYVFYDEDEAYIQRALAAVSDLEKHTEYWQSFQNGIASGITHDTETLNRWLAQKPYGLDDLPSSLKDRLVAPDGRYLINVVPAEDMTDRAKTDQFISEVVAVAPNVAGRTIVEWGVGNVVVASFLEASTISIVCIFILLVLYFRGIKLPILVLIPLVLTTLLVFTFIVATGLTLNMANILVVPLIFGLGVDTGVHVVHRYLLSSSVAELLRSSTSKAVFISALTTIGTFMSLSFSAHKGAASVGLLLSISITLLLFTTFIVLPALLAVFARK
ncbi:Uncharacterised protein [BD1-7 clade bacterium]|uniref:SSD domain-containing protein n=1 Tax=BD1-7 clade bacterium TaxID=2029982 RepID=A0A5S9QKY2_9GAMM|nr:Uncharacterised protein [BD1-7 clade bacterium]